MKIVFTKRAEKSYNLIKEYIRKEWGYKLEEAFQNKPGQKCFRALGKGNRKIIFITSGRQNDLTFFIVQL